MNKLELRKKLNSIYNEISNANFNNDYQIKEIFFQLIRFNENLIAELDAHLNNKKELNTCNLEKHFIDGVREIINNGATLNVDILNWYRNLYYKEGNNTERGIMAHTINNLFMEMRAKGIELSSLYTSRID